MRSPAKAMRLALLNPETRFEHMLARDLGHGSIATMRRRLSQREFMAWVQFYNWESRERALQAKRAQIKRARRH
jgi:hypothetical protein